MNVLLSWAVALSIVAFGLFGFDKRRAQQGGARVPEIVLHLVGWAGGAPGALVGMRFWRHKTHHAEFWISQFGALIIWAGLLVAALS
ncbi:DUF1294 domain-containing protein [Candidatus Gracilibacteria bacterium]|nr:DUF1294 domain-containing protein [Candidatus Gracilibacteria bacterium]